MNRIQELDAIVKQYDLNAHPFYQDWRMGTLPVEKLRDYAAEYGKFVGTISEGWETLSLEKCVAEEKYHQQLWADFELEIGATAGQNHSTTETLVSVARNCFKTKTQAIGALYAFEAQNPETTKSKYDGLTEHYGTSEKGKKYFLVHTTDFNEITLLREMLEGLSEAEFRQVKHACVSMCAAMLGGLDGVYDLAA